MAFIDRMTHLDESLARSNHLIAAGIWLLIRGEITRPQFVSALELDASDDTQIDEIQAHYTALSAAEKDMFFGDFSAYTIALEAGKITGAFFKNRFGMT